MAHSTRPTLPPLHSLDLPRSSIQLPSIHELFSDLDQAIPQSHHVCTVMPSRPSLSNAQCLRLCTNTEPRSTSTAAYPMRKIRLIHTSFENADAVMLVTPSSDPNTRSPQPLLLLGPALQQLRQGTRKLDKGTRVHPYRIARSDSP